MLNDDHLRHQLPEMGTSKMRNDTMKKQFTPEFSDLMRQYRDTAAGLGHDHPIARRLWLIVLTAAPDWFLVEAHQTGRDMGLLPEPAGCDDTGQPFYALDDIAAKLGVSEEGLRSQLAELQADAAEVGLKTAMTGDAGNLHRLH